jgi:hypothetical protein
VFDQWQQVLARQKVNSDHTASEFDATAAPPVLFEQAGAIQAIHLSGLAATAAEHDCLTVLGHTAGVTSSHPATSSSRSRPGLETNPFRHPTRSSCADLVLWVSNARLSGIRFRLAHYRRHRNQALSPAVNDPTTAVQILGYIELSCIGSAPRTCAINTHMVAAPDRRDAIQAELSLLDESIAKVSPMRLGWRSPRASDPQRIGAPTMEWTYPYRGRRH